MLARDLRMAAATILVVDDEPGVLDVVSQTLGHEGYRVVVAANPRRGLEIVRRLPFIDLVLSDISMPEMQGTELVAEVARISPGTARVLMTGGAVDSEQIPADVPVIRKPLSTAVLLSACQDALDRSNELRSRFALAVERHGQLKQTSAALLSECGEAVRQTMDLLERSRTARRHRERIRLPG
jgi:CheY-like chemotaxis protein